MQWQVVQAQVFFTGVFHFNTVTQGNVKDGFAGLSFQNCAIRNKGPHVAEKQSLAY